MNLTSSLMLPTNLQNVPIVDLRGKLPVNANYTWKTLASGGRANGIRDLSKVTTIVMHHDSFLKKDTAKYTDEEFAGRIATSHINSRNNLKQGDPGFPYQAYIRNGTIYVCNDVEDHLFGVAGNNDYTVHICVSGNYSGGDTLTDTDRNALYAAFYLMKSNMPAYKEVKGHNELNPSQCPGYDVIQVRSDLANIDNQIGSNESYKSQLARAYVVANQILYMYNLAKSKEEQGNEEDGEVKWVLLNLLKLEKHMKEYGIL